MNKAYMNFKKTAVAGVLSASLLAACLLPIMPTHTADAADAQGITIKRNGYEIYLETAPFKLNDTVYMGARELSKEIRASIVWDNKTKQATLSNPHGMLVLSNGVTAAMRNGKADKLPAPPVMKDGRLYVPIRAVAEALGVIVSWRSNDRTVELRHSADLLLVEDAKSAYWLDRQTGQVHEAKPLASKPKPIGKMDIKMLGFSNLTLSSEGETSQLVFDDQYGEPAINKDSYSALIYQSKIVKQTHVHYWERLTPNITYDGVNPIMTDGKTLFLMNENGQVAKEMDLVALAGWDEVYTIEGIGKSYVLVRPNRTGLLTLINLETNKTIQLYKLLNKDEQNFAETIEVPYHGDQLDFMGEKDGVLYFTYWSFFTEEKEELTYKLDNN